MKESFANLIMLIALITAMTAVHGQQAADVRVADLVRAGKLRVALFLPQYTKDPATGEIRGHTTGTVTVPIAHELATRIGVRVQLIGHPSPTMVIECLKAGECDLAFMGINPSRAADVRFSPPLIVLPYTYLVPAGSSIRNVADADRHGHRIAVVGGHESTTALSRVLKHAEIVSAPTPDAAFDLLRSGQAQAFASPHAALLGYLAKLPGSRVLDDYYGANQLALAVGKEHAARLAYFSEFMEEVKASGFVQQAIERTGQRGIRVASPADVAVKK